MASVLITPKCSGVSELFPSYFKISGFITMAEKQRHDEKETSDDQQEKDERLQLQQMDKQALDVGRQNDQDKTSEEHALGVRRPDNQDEASDEQAIRRPDNQKQTEIVPFTPIPLALQQSAFVQQIAGSGNIPLNNLTGCTINIYQSKDNASSILASSSLSTDAHAKMHMPSPSRELATQETLVQALECSPPEKLLRDESSQRAADLCEVALKSVYKTTGSFIQMIPWVDDDKRHIMDIYTKLKTRGKIWLETEVQTLAMYVKENKQELHGSGGGAAVEQRKRKAWKAAAQIIQASSGVLRDWETVRKKWSDLAYRAKKYKADRIGKKFTGGGPQPPVNTTLEFVLEALPDEITEGLWPSGSCESIPQASTSTGLPSADTGHVFVTPIQSCGLNPQGDCGLSKQPSCWSSSASTSESQSQEDDAPVKPGKRKRRQDKQKQKKTAKKTPKDEVGLLELNQQLLYMEKEKMNYKEQKLQLLQEMVGVLKRIDANLERIAASPSPLQIFESMQPEL